MLTDKGLEVLKELRSELSDSIEADSVGHAKRDVERFYAFCKNKAIGFVGRFVFMVMAISVFLLAVADTSMIEAFLLSDAADLVRFKFAILSLAFFLTFFIYVLLPIGLGRFALARDEHEQANLDTLEKTREQIELIEELLCRHKLIAGRK